MAKYFKVEGSSIARGPVPKASISDPHVSFGVNIDDLELASYGWLPQVVVGDDPYDPLTQRRTGPVHTYSRGADHVTSTYTVTDKTAQEIADEKEASAIEVTDRNDVDALIKAIATVQEAKGGAITSADVADVRTAMQDDLKTRALAAIPGPLSALR